MCEYKAERRAFEPQQLMESLSNKEYYTTIDKIPTTTKKKTKQSRSDLNLPCSATKTTIN